MTLKRHIFLVGFMGSGKSTVGRALARHLGTPFVDLDRMIESQLGQPITTIFVEKGEEAFRDAETHALLSTGDLEPAVIACGGGVILRPENRSYLKSAGVVVYLVVTAGEAIARIGDAASRPLLAGPGATLAATSLLAARESLYLSVADITINTTGLDARSVVERVTEAIEDQTA